MKKRVISSFAWSALATFCCIGCQKNPSERHSSSVQPEPERFRYAFSTTGMSYRWEDDEKTISSIESFKWGEKTVEVDVKDGHANYPLPWGITASGIVYSSCVQEVDGSLSLFLLKGRAFEKQAECFYATEYDRDFEICSMGDDYCLFEISSNTDDKQTFFYKDGEITAMSGALLCNEYGWAEKEDGEYYWHPVGDDSRYRLDVSSETVSSCRPALNPRLSLLDFNRKTLFWMDERNESQVEHFTDWDIVTQTIDAGFNLLDVQEDRIIKARWYDGAVTITDTIPIEPNSFSSQRFLELYGISSGINSLRGQMDIDDENRSIPFYWTKGMDHLAYELPGDCSRTILFCDEYFEFYTERSSLPENRYRFHHYKKNLATGETRLLYSANGDVTRWPVTNLTLRIDLVTGERTLFH